MANVTQVITRGRGYTRVDFTALRAFVQRVPATAIARLYFPPDENGDDLSPAWVEQYLRRMQAELVELAIEHGSSVLADHLRASTRKHGSARLTAVTLKMVEQAAELAVAAPAPGHAVGMWFRPMVSQRLRAAGIATLGELVAYCNRRGGSWWRGVPRIGAGRARHIVSWLRRHEASIGERVVSDVDLADPFCAGELVLIDAGRQLLAPLERMDVPHALSGTDGVNRARVFPYIAARHDLDAVRAYLHQYREQPKTLRAYTKELERFLLWAVCVRGKALSSLLVDDCEAYKDFLAAPAESFVGPRAPRSSGRWRPFASAELSADTRRYAVRVLRAAFAWLVDIRYLDGNPWKAVKDPVVVDREFRIDVGRALPSLLWIAIRRHIDHTSTQPRASFWRTLRALMLLMGDSGLRREEAATARREALRRAMAVDASLPPIWEMTVIGKRKKERTVSVSLATVDALRAHWRDRGRDFDEPGAGGPLVAPVSIPSTPQALRKHGITTGEPAVPDAGQPYSVDVLNQLIERARRRLLTEMADLSADDRARLASISPHSFRHTFGTELAAANVAPDIIQHALGHASIGTTTIYVHTERRRMHAELARVYTERSVAGSG
ncbi:integrase [Burkholderia pseudomallei]|uniref:phage integrase family protein n=1 Tax=Burkholderia pseudomallei TaxID=28450 RepID=UPI0009773122|nr:phage integrase family protein [Burkholderia pseudomallei]ONC30060.1 integrase [Burkholderia pseudomallei]